ncbi:single-stranded DNA-binding protein [Legionella yabuuchiae]|uniref:single-stranded DNA-binding protein n=1 Tax=Legionella yabuuchiae TaxID=376727 RepID=UPI001054CDAF|nr:single-stranded DNA-binding protein [Legionella yabuuchiae]
MTASLNRVTLIGNLGADPKTIAGKDGQYFVTATLATNESFKQNEEWKSRVEWHQLVMFGKLTKIADYLKKGSQVYVEGKLRSNQWTDGDGNTRQSLSIVVNNIQLIGHSKSADETSCNTAESQLTKMREVLQDESEDVPF